MNTTLHPSDDVLEDHSCGRLSSQDCAPLEEHLLICPVCQDRLAEIEEYIRVLQTALAALGRSSRMARAAGSPP